MSLVALVYLTSLTSCSKSSGGGTTASQMSLTIDGTVNAMDTANLEAFWLMDTVQQTQTTTVVSKTLHLYSQTSKGDVAVFAVAPAKASGSVVAGTYSETSSTNFYTYAIYAPIDSINHPSTYFQGYFGGIIAPAYQGILSAAQVNSGTANAVQVVITSIDANWVKGTVKGDTYYTAVSSDYTQLLFTYGNKHSMTAGTFTARMYN